MEQQEDTGRSHTSRFPTPQFWHTCAGTARTEARPWTPDEERLFREALELHGRDWGACAAHIGSRDAKSVTSHAQKYVFSAIQTFVLDFVIKYMTTHRLINTLRVSRIRL